MNKERRSQLSRLATRVATIVGLPAPDAYQDAGPSDSRRGRKPTFKRATITLAHGEELPVIIRDLSSTGARLEYFQNRTLGPTLHIREPTTGIATKAVVIWQGERACGIQFV